MAGRFETRLREGPPLVGDGGMGSLITAAVPRLRVPEEANLRAPDAVVSLHLSFINAGAEVIETNTFGANRRKLATHFLEEELEQINSVGVKLARDAREVSGRDVFIAGAMGPIGEAATPKERNELFAEQAALLDGRGADLFMLETFYDLEELVDAIAALRSVSQLPIVALLTFDEGAETLAGVTAREAADRLAGFDLAAIGANHGAGPAAALDALAEMRANGAVLAAVPNVGLASMSGQRVVFPHASPDYFAEFTAQARELGAALVGGCCGTTPVEIAAIRGAIDENRKPARAFRVSERELAEPLPPSLEETRLARMLASGEFVVSVQLDPPLGANPEALIQTAHAVKALGPSYFVDVNDNPRARARMSGLMASIAIERLTGIETIPHLTPRDSTIVGLESLLLGTHAEGVRNILAVTGDPPEAGDYPGTHAVYEIDSIGLVDLIEGLNRGADFHGRAIDAPTSFHIGVAVNPTADDLGLEAERFHLKVAAGARFAMTQVLFELEPLAAFEERLGGWSIPVLVGIWPVRSYELAVRVHNETPGIVVPDYVQERYRKAGAAASELGDELARELIGAARKVSQGMYVVAPFRQPLGVIELLD